MKYVSATDEYRLFDTPSTVNRLYPHVRFLSNEFFFLNSSLLTYLKNTLLTFSLVTSATSSSLIP